MYSGEHQPLQSKKLACVRTDSKSYIQSFEKFCCGEFSISSRVTTFLPEVSCYQIPLCHLCGSSNLSSDFQCHNVPECHDQRVQNLRFRIPIQKLLYTQHFRQECLLRLLQVALHLQFHMESDSDRMSWLTPRTCSPCVGTKPSKKVTDADDVKQYLHHISISSDDLLIIKRKEVFADSR